MKKNKIDIGLLDRYAKAALGGYIVGNVIATAISGRLGQKRCKDYTLDPETIARAAYTQAISMVKERVKLQSMQNKKAK